MDKCFHCGTEKRFMLFGDNLGNPLCDMCVDEWDLSGRPNGRFLEFPNPQAPRILHWQRDTLFGGEVVMLGYPGFNGAISQIREAANG